MAFVLYWKKNTHNQVHFQREDRTGIRWNTQQIVRGWSEEG